MVAINLAFVAGLCGLAFAAPAPQSESPDLAARGCASDADCPLGLCDVVGGICYGDRRLARRSCSSDEDCPLGLCDVVGGICYGD